MNGLEKIVLLSGIIGCRSYDSRNQDNPLEDDVFAGDTYEEDNEQHTPEIITENLSYATTSKEYSTLLSATDADGDALEFTLLDGSDWLTIASATGELYGIPVHRGTETVTVEAQDSTGKSDTKTYSLVINPVATADINIYNAGGYTDSEPIDTSCSVEVLVTSMNDESYSELASVGTNSIAHFELDMEGVYDIYIEPTNTGSNCYSGMYQEKWFDVVEGTNTAWAHLIPETEAESVAEVVDGVYDLSDKGWSSNGIVDNVTELMQYMTYTYSSEIMGWDGFRFMYGLELDVQNGLRPLYIENTGGFTYNNIDYDSCFADAAALWEGHLAPAIEFVPDGSYVDVSTILDSNVRYWSIFIGFDDQDLNGELTLVGDVWFLRPVEIQYAPISSYEQCVETAAHELGHIYLDGHGLLEDETNLPEYIMAYSSTTDSSATVPHEHELLVARMITNIGNLSPSNRAIYGDPSAYFNY